MTPQEIELEFKKREPLFKSLVENVISYSKRVLLEANVKHFQISGRVKDYESFLQKIERKNYENPFEENLDFCGVRIITNYLKEVDQVKDVINKSFRVHESLDKSSIHEPNEFGYRSYHFIVEFPFDETEVLNSQEFGSQKIEIQVRTILMHAWAEIQHDVAYKREKDIPDDFQRQLFWLCAKFEEADFQFERIKEDIQEYKKKIEIAVGGKSMSNKIDLNLDTLSSILDYYLPDFPKNNRNTTTLLHEFISDGLTFDHIEGLIKKITPFAIELNDSVFPDKRLRLTQATILSYARDILDGYHREHMYSTNRIKIVEIFKEKLKNKDEI